MSWWQKLDDRVIKGGKNGNTIIWQSKESKNQI